MFEQLPPVSVERLLVEMLHKDCSRMSEERKKEINIVLTVW